MKGILTALLTLLAGSLHAQWTPFPPDKLSRIQAGIREVYGLDYQRAADRFQAMIRESPQDPTGYTYLVFTEWVRELNHRQELSIDRFAAPDFFSEQDKYVPTVAPAVQARFEALAHQAVGKAQESLRANPRDAEARYLIGLAHQNWSSFEVALNRRWGAALTHGLETQKYHSQLIREFSQFNDARLAEGVYQYALGSFPWYYRFLVLLLGRHGSLEDGKAHLEATAQKGRLVADDARLILILIHTRERNYDKAAALMREMYGRYPSNYLLPLGLGGLALLQRQPDRAIEIYRDVLQKRDAGTEHFRELERAAIYNRLAAAARQKRDFAAATAWSEKALSEKATSASALALSHLELGKTLDLLGRRAEALGHYRQVAGSLDVAGSRTEAERLMKRPFGGR